MKKSKFSDSPILEALKRVEGGLSVPELCRELGISSATFYKWRAARRQIKIDYIQPGKPTSRYARA
jgi:transposase-like protein